MMIELHSMDIELIKRMLKLTEKLKIDKHRYTIQLPGGRTVYLKVYNPTNKEHDMIINDNGLQTTKATTMLFSSVREWQLYEFLYPGMKE